MLSTTYLRSYLRVLYTSLCVLYLVLIAALSSSPVKAQTATNTPVPTSAEIHPTFGAIQTNTPSILTSTPHATPDVSGCPFGRLEDAPLDDAWAAYCSRCIANDDPTITPVAHIPDFQLGTVSPLSTASGSPTPAPTYPPMYSEGGTATPVTPTVAPSATPAFTVTPAFHEVYWDFRSGAHGTEGGFYPFSISGALWGYCHVASPGFVLFPSGYRDGAGYRSDPYTFDPGRCSGQAFSVGFPSYESMHQTNMVDMALYVEGAIDSYFVITNDDLSLGSPDDSHTCAYWGQSDRCDGTRLGWSMGSAYRQDVRGLTAGLINYGGEGRIVGFSFAYYGDTFVEGEGSTPTPTPPPTATLRPPPNCAVPEYKDIDTPIAQLDFVPDDIATECYTVIPEIDASGIGHPELYFEGLEMCVHWKHIPVLGFFGITFGIDLLLIIPIAWLIRRLLTF